MTFTPLHLELLAACHRGHFVHAGYQSLYHDLTAVNLIERNNDGEPLLTRKGIEFLKLVAGLAEGRALYTIQSESTGFPPIKNQPVPEAPQGPMINTPCQTEDSQEVCLLREIRDLLKSGVCRGMFGSKGGLT